MGKYNTKNDSIMLLKLLLMQIYEISIFFLQGEKNNNSSAGVNGLLR